MKTIRTKNAMVRYSDLARKKGTTIAFVPTMGALHDGHLTLIRKAKATGAHVVVSIYVNPTQFGPSEDFNKYPRQLVKDAALARKAGADILFAPASMYDNNDEFSVDPGNMATLLCGKRRPGHFKGVATVVLKFFNIVKPHFAYFGQKDAQQVVIISKMVKELDLNVKIIPVATVREKDGLAMSSRNNRLSANDRLKAVSLYKALSSVRTSFEGGNTNPSIAIKKGTKELLGRLEYLTAVNPETLLPVKRLHKGVLVAGAMHLGDTRLIDNIFL
ncbi:MAG: pantoate--beta-alanine ligase [Fibrobacteres bacterium]|nr:pantoate--beta-alanine ligase [Fibrobacterota bacterium]